MSRGLGRDQRRVVDALSENEEVLKTGLTLSALRPALPRDRSNARRVIQSLFRRGDVERVTDEETGEERIKLEFFAGCAALMRKREAEETPYNGQDKFGTPEDAPQSYILADGREVNEKEFMAVLRREAVARGIV
jgi:hypothetical protein